MYEMLDDMVLKASLRKVRLAEELLGLRTVKGLGWPPTERQRFQKTITHFQ